MFFAKSRSSICTPDVALITFGPNLVVFHSLFLSVQACITAWSICPPLCQGENKADGCWPQEIFLVIESDSRFRSKGAFMMHVTLVGISLSVSEFDCTGSMLIVSCNIRHAGQHKPTLLEGQQYPGRWLLRESKRIQEGIEVGVSLSLASLQPSANFPIWMTLVPVLLVTLIASPSLLLVVCFREPSIWVWEDAQRLCWWSSG